MSNLDPRIEAIRVKYDLDRSDFWELPQKKGTWIAKHSALEVVAVKENIIWSMPQILEASGADGIAAMVVAGTLKDRTEWATGEASPKNNKNAYPWAMAEKRAKDRVVLKLSGIAGLVYSEDEADDFKQPAQSTEKAADAPKAPTVAVLKENFTRLKAELLEQQSQGWRVMAKWLNDASVLAEIEALGRYAEDFKAEARDIFDLAKKSEEEFGKVLPVEARGSDYVEPSFDGLDSSK